MSDESTDHSATDSRGSGRCPNCDFLALPGDSICRMCGAQLPRDAADVPPPAADAGPDASAEEAVAADDALDAVSRPAVEEVAPPPSPEAAPAAEAEDASAPEGAADEALPPAAADYDAPPPAADAAAVSEPPAGADWEEELGLGPDPFLPVEQHLLADLEAEPLPDEVEMVMRERQAPLTTIMTLVVAVITVVVGYLVLQVSAESPAAVQLFPTPSPLPPTMTLTPSITPFPTETPAPTLTPSITPTPRPSDTPQAPRFHTVQPNESLFTLAVFYGVTVDSIAAVNERLPNSPLLVDEELIIPWPTATPPLVAVTVELDGQTFLADPLDCANIYTIQSNDSLVSIGAQFNVDFRAVLAVNRLTADTLLQPGDTICIPQIDLFDGELPPTPGPSPTPLPPGPPAGPTLLFPPDDADFAAGDPPPVLQWAAVKDLDEDEWYMVEVVDLTDVDAFPRRGFTRDTALVLPPEWQPTTPEVHRFRWNVRIITVTGQREDGAFIRSYGGRTSADGRFSWEGQVPRPTPTVTPGPTATPQ